MVNDPELAALIARDVFKALDQPDDVCQRLQGMGGTYPGRETMLGGLNEKAVAELIQQSLGEHRSY